MKRVLSISALILLLAQAHAQESRRPRKWQITYLTYGLPTNWWDGDEYKPSCEQEVMASFGYKKMAIAGCVINSRIERRAYLKNAYCDFIQVFRFGLRWKQKEEKCRLACLRK